MIGREEPGAWLFARPTGGIRWGLERTEALLAGVGNPHRRFSALHVAGTNGKGSVCALADSALRSAFPDRTFGLYTSPHLVSFAERIRIGGVQVERELLLSAEARLRPMIEQSGATFFEATTAIAFLCFAEAGVETATIEVGLGGRLDATNVLTPLATAVTSIAQDHVEFLGTEIAGIAGEKAGIFKPGVPAIVGEGEEPALSVLRDRARAVGAPFVPVDITGSVSNISVALDGTRFRLRSPTFGEHALHTSLLGAHQAANAAVAVELLAALPDALRPPWSAIRSGFATVRWPGRMQVERRSGTTWVFDVAHNPAGVATLVHMLDGLDFARPLVAVVGILSDKDWSQMLAPLAQRVEALVLAVPPSAPAERRWNPSEAAAGLQSGTGTVRVIPDLAAALHRASTLAPYGTVVVTGSFHTVGDALQILEFASE